MIIPSKHSGYQAGIRVYPSGGGGSSAMYAQPNSQANTQQANAPSLVGNAGIATHVTPVSNTPITQANFDSKAYLAANPDVASELNRGVANFGDAYGHYTRYGMNEGRLGSAINPNATPTNAAGTSSILASNPALQSMVGKPYNQAGQSYNSLLQQGYTGSDIRNALSTDGKPISESDYGMLVQNAGMTSPTGRPMAGSDQFFQPVYNSSYMNYARPATQFDVSSYGTQPANSLAFNSGMSRNAINQNLNSFYQDNYRDNPMGVSMSDTLGMMRNQGINRDDIQQWGGVNNYGPQMSMPQTPMPFNPYTNSSSRQGLGTTGLGSLLGSVYGGGQQGNVMPPMQNPYSYQQPSYQPSYQQPMQPPSIPQRTSSGPRQAIVGRSAQLRGAPNVRRYAEGGITALLDQDE